MRTALVTLSLLAGLSLSMVAFAGGHGPGGHRGPPPPMGPLLHGLQDLDLDADQQAQLDGVLETMEAERPERPERPARGERPERPSEAEREAHHAERKARAEALEAQLALETPDREPLHAALDDGRGGPAPQLVHEHLDLLLDVHAGLSADQRAELVDTLAERRTERGERGERGECRERGERRDRGEE